MSDKFLLSPSDFRGAHTLWVPVDARRCLVRFPPELEVLSAASIKNESRNVFVRVPRKPHRADVPDKNVMRGWPKCFGFMLQSGQTQDSVQTNDAVDGVNLLAHISTRKLGQFRPGSNAVTASRTYGFPPLELCSRRRGLAAVAATLRL